MKEIKEFLSKEIKDNSTVVVACSGGPDSMCLLSLVCDFLNSTNLKIIVAHVNHKLRTESDEEEVFVKNYACEKNILFEVSHFDEFKNNKFSEELARRKRYSFFEEIVKKYEANYLLTAHHGDDLIETVLMRITRGSNLKGYAGIKRVSEKENYKILRPLLTVTKDDILKYNDENGISYVVDKTNESDKYTRNRYRKYVLPFLKKEEKNVHKKYYQFSNELLEYDNFVNEYIITNEFIVDNYIVINKIKNESLFIKRKTIELLVKKIQEYDQFDINNLQVNEIINMLDKTNKSIDLNNGYKCIKDYDRLTITKNTSCKTDYQFTFDKKIEYDNWKITSVTNSDKDTNFEIRLNSEEIKLPLIIRNRRIGDKMEIKNLNGSKKIKDIFIDEKVSLTKRDIIPIVTDTNDVIVWIPGIKKSKFAKDKTEKYDIILRYEVINK